MKTLVFFLILSFGLSSLLNTVNAQKISNCTPQLPDKNWSVVLDSPLNGVDLSKAVFKITPIQEGTNLTVSSEKEVKTGLSACVLDYLLENQELIPSEWKGKSIIFTGTIFKDGGGNALYKTLIYQDGKWTWGKNYLEYILEKSYRVTLSFLTTRHKVSCFILQKAKYLV